jgi:KipI family sensor histidine kinase inhibitor
MPDTMTEKRRDAQAPRFLASGDTALCVEFGDRIDREVSARVLALANRIQVAEIAGVVELVPTFRSLLVHYDPSVSSQATLRASLEPLVVNLDAAEGASRRWTLPACYDVSVAPDLEEVAARTGLSVREVIERHSAVTYHVYMLGFLPGYPYLGDLPPELALPRRENPRTRVPPGSIAIATTMTAVYPLESPGGWHLIGRTPVALWDVRRDPPVLLSAGDKIVFAPISLKDYEAMAAKAAAGALNIVPESGVGAA